MNMGYLEAGDHESYPRRAQQPLLHVADGMGDLGQVRGLTRGEVGPLVDLVAGHDEAVAAGKGTNVEECDTVAVGVDESRRDLAVDDSSEYGGHR